VQKILGSRRFATSERQARLFRYLLRQTLEGHAAELKEYVLGVEVFDRPTSFDPQTDAIVRAEMSRLRGRLTDYYESEGREDSLILELPKRSYGLAFRLRESGNGSRRGALVRNAKPERLWLWLSTRRIGAVTLLIAGLAAVSALAPANRWNGQRERAAANLTSVAVLPFVNLTDDQESEDFSEGLTEELIHSLAKIDGLRVASRTSTLQLEGKHEDVQTIASKLNVGVVLEGTVRRAGNRLRINVRLINAADGYKLDSQVYERGLQNVLAVQEEIARRVASTLSINQLKRK
jgi:TolB-like protein